MGTFFRPDFLPMTDAWIETGTCLGDSIRAALALGYSTIKSVEVNEALHTRARDLFQHEPRVILFQGSSPARLPDMIYPAQPTTFWLDAHWQGFGREEMDENAGECPLIAELVAIFSQPWRRRPHVVIDDYAMFREPPPTAFDARQWPCCEQIEELLPTGIGYHSKVENNAWFFIAPDDGLPCWKPALQVPGGALADELPTTLL
jgi:hypothetical protein